MSLLGRNVGDNAFSVLPVVVDLEVVHRFERVQEAYVFEMLVRRKETLAKVLRTLQVLQYFDELLRIFGLNAFKEQSSRLLARKQESG